MRPTTQYVTNAVEFDKHKERLKFVPCPHCRTVGDLIRHGYLWGKGERGTEKVQRGWRIFCSNRRRRGGCGRTHSILRACLLHHCMIDAHRLWELLRGVLGGASVKAAWEKVAAPFCLETGYQLWHTFVRGQTFIRSLLRRAEAPPKMTSQDPNRQVIEHLRSVFRQSPCPVADFQVRWQTAFLPPAALYSNRSG